MKRSTNHSGGNEGQVIFYFQVHQPMRLASMRFLDIGHDKPLFNERLNRDIMTRVAERCYLPVNAKIRQLISKFPDIKVCFSLSGTVVEQFDMFHPAVSDSFRDLAQTGSVEFLGETFYHSLSSLTPNDEFTIQVDQHSALMEERFGVRPQVFRNTELIYSSSIASRVAKSGFKAIVSDGVDRTLDGRSPYHVYSHPALHDFNIFLRSNKLSDDIAFRFLHGSKPLEVEKFCNRLYDTAKDGNIVLLGLDYETFGEHYSEATGIISFLERLLLKLHADKRVRLSTLSSASVGEKVGLDIHELISWADEAKDISAWLGNEMQCDAFKTLNALEEHVKRTGNTELLSTWRHLQGSDHFYYMSTKRANDGQVHAHFSHYNSPYEAFINYMNVLADFSLRIPQTSGDPLANIEKERRHSDVPIWAQQYAASVSNMLG